MPTTGTRSRTAVSMASTMCRQPSTPIAPPMTVASVQNAIAGAPSTVPRAASTPEVSCAASVLHRAGVEEPLQAVLGIARVGRGQRRCGLHGGQRSSGSGGVPSFRRW